MENLEPKTCKEWKGQTVILTQSIQTNGGALFFKGERLIVKRKSKDGTFELTRPAASIVTIKDGCFVIDPKKTQFRANLKG